MNEKRLDWDDLNLFLAVARAGGLSGAVATTGKSAPTLGRRMLLLEANLGAELFQRLPRGYVLTEEGTALLAKAVNLEAQIQTLQRNGEKSGQVLVKVSAGSWATHLLCQNAEAILKDDTSTILRLISAEHLLDIAHREAIIGIRNQRPEQHGLACQKLGVVKFAGYATDTSVRPWVRVRGSTPSAQWLAGQVGAPSRIEVTAPRNALDLAKSGVARALLPTFIGDAEQSLKRVTPVIDELSHDQWLVTHQDDRFVPEVRSIIDRIATFLQKVHRG